jgi:hypothetical protein
MQKCLRCSYAPSDAKAATRNYYQSVSFVMLAQMQNAMMLRIIILNVSLHSVGILVVSSIVSFC